MNVLIIENEIRNFNWLKRMLAEVDASLHIDGPMTCIADAMEYLETALAPDLILADIRLSDGLSFEIFRRTRINSPIIFTTAYDEYAIHAFKYNSIDYLLKPIGPEELKNALQKVRKQNREGHYADDIRRLLAYVDQPKIQYREHFLVSYRDGFTVVYTQEICYISLHERNTVLYLQDGTSANIALTLDELEKQLNPELFFRVNRKQMVCREYITRLSYYFDNKLKVHLKYEQEEEIIASRERAVLLKKWLDR